MYESLFQPLTVRGLTLKNRIVFAPTSMGLKSGDFLAHIDRIARGGAGLIVIGDVPVLPSPMFSLYTPEGLDFYRQITQTAHAGGAKISAQLHMSDSDVQGLQRYLPDLRAGRITPDDLRRKLNDMTGDFITGLPVERIQTIIDGFGQAAILARDAGFDMIQIHGDRMCGSFSSSIYNHRTDAYGGSPENRARFAVSCVQAVRRAVPDMPIEYKLAVRQENPHYGNAGILSDELPVFVPLLDEAGVDCYEVALANHGALTDTIPPHNHPYFSEPGCFLKFCDLVRPLTDRPLCGVGGLGDPDFAAAQVDSGRVDYIALSRPLIADPDWPRLVQNGQTDQIFRCVRCNRACLGGMQQHQGTHCVFDEKRRAARGE